MRICVFSERLKRPYDEGIKNFAVHLMRALAPTNDVLALTCGGLTDPEYGIENIEVNRLLLSARLSERIREFQPQAIVYVPTACGTMFSFARARVLRHYGRTPRQRDVDAVARLSGEGVPDARMVLIVLQPRHYSALGRYVIHRLAPDWVFAQSVRTSDLLRSLGCRTALFPPAVDTERFHPASPAEKEMLRARYGIPASARVVSHVGHLQSERNLKHFLAFQALPGYHAVVVASTSTLQDEHIKETLRTAGTTVVDTYVPNIEDIYRLSDLYLFLPEQETAAIEMPLSVLEAMACNLPVICTPFGGLPDFFCAGDGLFYWDSKAQLGDLVATALSTTSATRTLVEPYTWAAAAQACVRLLQGDVVVGTQAGQESGMDNSRMRGEGS
jgi:glycosyltransferase involved in cell wall biosynthesis